jgi:glycosyltransferase involved in cell wall biosynthesis
VVFLGHVDDIPGFLNSIDILVQASTKQEPLGQTPLQGFAYAKPIIATEGGGPSEWIDSGINGLLVPPDQPQALAVALRELADWYELRIKLAGAAAPTKRILTDDECVAAHAEFFRAVRQAHRAESGRRLR